MYGKYHIVKNDLYDVAKRLKEIDKGYFLVYSYKKKRYEVHHGGQRDASFCLAVPHSPPDARTVLLVQKSRAQRINEYLEETERENALAAKTEREKAIKKAEINVEQALRTSV